MATKTRRRPGTKSRAKQPKRQAKAGTARRSASARRQGSGARKARAPQAARTASARAEAAAARAAAPVLRVAEPPPEDHDAEWGVEESEGEVAAPTSGVTSWKLEPGPDTTAADLEAAEIARRIEEAAGTAEDDLRRRADAAARELGLRRESEERDDDYRRMEDARSGLPGLGAMGVEIAVGAFRIARAVATAPLRIGLAFLRR